MRFDHLEGVARIHLQCCNYCIYIYIFDWSSCLYPGLVVLYRRFPRFVSQAKTARPKRADRASGQEDGQEDEGLVPPKGPPSGTGRLEDWSDRHRDWFDVGFFGRKFSDDSDLWRSHLCGVNSPVLVQSPKEERQVPQELNLVQTKHSQLEGI